MHFVHCCVATYSLLPEPSEDYVPFRKQEILPCSERVNAMFLTHLVGVYRQWRRYNQSLRELNRLGLMVDISHVSDKTFADALEMSRAPVIASHSSCRAIANHPRNMTDDMLRALAKNGGVVMINYEVSFLSEEYRVASDKASGGVVAQLAALSKKCGGDEACSTLESARINTDAMNSGALPKVSWEKIIEHIDHAVKVAGADHVGLGSDFDGATMPIGMEDASKLPKITDALLKKGYSEADVEKILGGNILRVMEQVERVKLGT